MIKKFLTQNHYIEYINDEMHLIEKIKNDEIHFNEKITIDSYYKAEPYHLTLKKNTIGLLECVFLLLGIDPIDIIFHDKAKYLKTKNAIAICETIVSALISEELSTVVKPSVKPSMLVRIFRFFLYDFKETYSKYSFENFKFIKLFLNELMRSRIKIKTYEFLKWSTLQTAFSLPIRLQKEMKIFTVKQKKMNIPTKNKIINQAIAQVLWFLDPWKNKINIEKNIKEDKVLSNYGRARDYTGINTFSRWLTDIDSRDLKNPTRRVPCSTYQIKHIPEVLLCQQKKLCVNYLKLKLILQNLTKTLNYKSNIILNVNEDSLS